MHAHHGTDLKAHLCHWFQTFAESVRDFSVIPTDGT
jgi:hypothetical protein